MSRSDRDRQRAAERAAARFLGEEEADTGADSGAERAAIGDDRAFASQLFVDSLLQSWATDGREESIARRERRVARTLDALGAPPRPRGSNRRVIYAAAACVIVGALIAALWFVPRGGTAGTPGPTRSTIDETLVRIDRELDAEYGGVLAIEMGGRAIELPMKLVSGPERHRVDLQTMFGEMSFGAAHGRRWFIPPGSDEAFDVTERHARMDGGMRRRMAEMFRLEWLEDVGGLLHSIRKHYAIEEMPAADGLVRLRATPRQDEAETEGPGARIRQHIESLDLTIQQATFRVETLTITMVRRDGLPMMFPMPVRIRVDFVKAYRAPVDLFWPAGLGARPVTTAPDRRQDR